MASYGETKKKEIVRPPGEIARLFQSEPSVDSDDDDVIAEREKMITRAKDAVALGRTLIGGQGVESGENPWLTNQQRQQYGMDGFKKNTATKKLKPGAIQEISPITGELVCNFPTSSWVSDFKKKQDAVTPKKVSKPRVMVNDDDARLIKQVKAQLTSRGSAGFIGLQRKFRLMDDDNSRSLNRSEFMKGLKEHGLQLTAKEIDRLFLIFDKDGSNSIEFDEFIYALRGELSDRRKKLIGMAFDVMDKDGNGVLEPSDVISAYDASKHPDVVAGQKTADIVMREFLDNFDVGGEKDGMVTRNEFENYYSNISASIDNEDYFELMIRNAWHIAGGEGQAANSTNQRVMITDASGNQKIVVVENDLGIKQGDKAGLVARLRAQGVQANQIDTTGAAGDAKEGFSRGEFASANRVAATAAPVLAATVPPGRFRPPMPPRSTAPPLSRPVSLNQDSAREMAKAMKVKAMVCLSQKNGKEALSLLTEALQVLTTNCPQDMADIRGVINSIDTATAMNTLAA